MESISSFSVISLRKSILRQSTLRRLTPIMLTLLFLTTQLGMASYRHTCALTGEQMWRLGWDFSCCVLDSCTEAEDGLNEETKSCCKDEFLQKLALEDEFASNGHKSLPKFALCTAYIPSSNIWPLFHVSGIGFEGFEIAACPPHGPPVSLGGRDLLVRKQVWNI